MKQPDPGVGPDSEYRELKPVQMLCINAREWDNSWGRYALICIAFLSEGSAYRLREAHPISRGLHREFRLFEETIVTERDLVLIGEVEELERRGFHFYGPTGGDRAQCHCV